jgi:hypothetical protein
MKHYKVTVNVSFTMTLTVAASSEEHAKVKMDNFLSDTLSSKVFQNVEVKSVEVKEVQDGVRP